MSMAKVDPALDDLIGRAERYRSRYEGAHLQWCTTLRDGTWAPTLGKLTFQRRAPDVEVLSYPRFIYSSTWLTVDEALELVRRAFSGDEFNVGGHSFALSGQFHYWPGREGVAADEGMVTYSSRHQLPLLDMAWPYYLYVFSIREPHGVTGEDLIARENPYYPSASDLIRDRMAIDQMTIYSTAFTVCVPHFIAAFSGISLTPGGFAVSAFSEDERIESLRVRYYARPRDGGAGLTAESELEHLRLSVDLGREIGGVRAVLIGGPDGDVLDVARLDVEEVADVLPQDLTPEAVETYAGAGEGEALEYKLRVSEPKGWAEFAETVVAFANTRGGMILVGVGDHGELDGSVRDDFGEAALRALRDRCDPPIEPLVARVEVRDGVHVDVVIVPESKTKPHILKDRGVIYVRAGANDMPATRLEIDAMYAERTGEEGPVGPILPGRPLTLRHRRRPR